jgi:hypothetical protein
MKKLLQSAEFWTTVVGAGISIFVMSGALSADEAGTVAEALVTIAKGVVTIAATFGIVKRRSNVKDRIFEAKREITMRKAGALTAELSGIDNFSQDL